MKTNAGAASAPEKNVFLTKGKSNNGKKPSTPIVLVGKNTAQVEKKKDADIQDAEIVQEEVNTQPVTEQATSKQPVTEQPVTTTEKEVVAPTVEEKPIKKHLSIEEIILKADKLQKLNARRTEIKTKIQDLEEFSISHDEENATLTLTDIKGHSIRTANPVSIGKVIGDWKELLYMSLEAKENEIRELAEA